MEALDSVTNCGIVHWWASVIAEARQLNDQGLAQRSINVWLKGLWSKLLEHHTAKKQLKFKSERAYMCMATYECVAARYSCPIMDGTSLTPHQVTKWLSYL